MATYTVDIRPRRQVTLPTLLLEKLGATVGDSLQIKAKGKSAIIVPKKNIALDALKEIQSVFSKTSITEKEIVKEIDKGRLIASK